MGCATFWCFIFLSLLVPIVTAPAKTEEGIETFEITVLLYSGQENPTWTFNASGNVLKSKFIKMLHGLEDHKMHAGHADHGGHGASVKLKKQKEIPSVNGYRGIRIKHTMSNGRKHEMVIIRCEKYTEEYAILLMMTIKKRVSKGTLPMMMKMCKQKRKMTAHSHNDGHSHKHKHHH